MVGCSFAAANVRGARPFAKSAKERGTHCFGDDDEIKCLGHTPRLGFWVIGANVR